MEKPHLLTIPFVLRNGLSHFANRGEQVMNKCIDCAACYQTKEIDPSTMARIFECRRHSPMIAFISVRGPQGVQVTKVGGYPSLAIDSVGCFEYVTQ